MEDLIVVGAGWYGMVMAKTYKDVNASHRIILLDANSSVGGVWAKEKLYPGLKSNNMLGTFQWSDFPMATETYGVKPGEHIPGAVLHNYLSDYAEKYDLLKHLQLSSKVKTIERKYDDTWLLTIDRHGESLNLPTTILAKRLVLATGMASEPNIPYFNGEDSFGGTIFHFADYAKHSEAATASTTKRVAVLGGAKSAWDFAYASATAGVPVEWIIRKSGAGPNWMAPPYVTPLKIWLEKLVFTRFLTWFSPCVWGDADGYGWIRSLLHGTWLGRFVVDKFWWMMGNDVISLNGYEKHPETKKLKPWSDAFWVGSMLSILNYPNDFFELVRNGMIKVHIADVEKMSPGTIHLSSGDDVKADLVCLATGWKHRPNINFLPAGIERELGLPHFSSSDELSSSQADAEIFQRFPRLKKQPTDLGARETIARYEKVDGVETLNRPFLLYRFMTPPAFVSKRNIGYAGMLTPLSTPMVSQIQALWLTAYFKGGINIAPVSSEHFKQEAELENRFCRWRYPAGFGARYPDFVFDTVPYIDLLLKDLGLESHRKKGVLAEVFQPYGPEDYVGLIEEWRALRGGESTATTPKNAASDRSPLLRNRA